MPPSVTVALGRVVGALPAGGEQRPGQSAMAEAVATAIATRRHLIVTAGTGTGKTLAYLVPALLSGSRVVVSTATKALQDQLAHHDLPTLGDQLGVPVTFAVLKGRSNYLCRQRADEVATNGEQLTLTDAAGTRPGPLGREVRRLVAWAETAETGDRADLSWEPTPAAWAQVSVGVDECPGATRCPSGDVCFAEAARRRASQADVVIVNTHLYATHLAAGGEVLPPHDVVVFDEAHELEDIASTSLGFELSGARVRALARAGRPLLEDAALAGALEEVAALFDEALARHRGARLARPFDADIGDRLIQGRERASRFLAALRHSEVDPPRAARALLAATHLIDDLDQVVSLTDGQVAWVEGPSSAPVLKVAPLDIAATLAELLWTGEDAPTAVLTSATVPIGLGPRLGLDPASFTELDVGSPFDYPEQALLYCARHLPDPRHAGFEAAMHNELVLLINAAEGRTMALFTSWRAMEVAAKAVAPRVPWPVLTQSDLPKPALVARFAAEEQSCLFATMGFWQGVDIPGPALSLVTIDRLPFPRPDDPLLQARRDRLGAEAFRLIDVPRAATLLAQGTGRLIRSGTDRGVVAVLDRRLTTASYSWDLVRSLPPMRRTRQRVEVEKFLAPLRVKSRGAG